MPVHNILYKQVLLRNTYFTEVQSDTLLTEVLKIKVSSPVKLHSGLTAAKEKISRHYSYTNP